MCLKILENELLCDNIMKFLSIKDKKNMSLVSKQANNIMKSCGYFDNVIFKCDNLDNYTKSLELINIHSRFIKQIIIKNEKDIFTYIPRGIEIKYNIIIQDCKILVKDKKIFNRISKMLLKNCTIQVPDYKKTWYYLHYNN